MEDEEPKYLQPDHGIKIDVFENLIMMRLMMNPDDFEGSQKKAAKKAQFKAF